VNNAVSRAAGLLAIAAFGIVLAWAFDASLTSALARAGLPRELVEATLAQKEKLAGIAIADGTPAETARVLRGAIGAAFVAGFRWVMGICAALALLSAASAWVMIEGKGARAKE
jgi:hypothetical protein